jgi:acetyl/propionyl-CoA carboxylase alpha subunit
LDAGFDAGDVVPSAYDSLIAKAMSWGTSRERARHGLAERLSGELIVGIQTNIGFLFRCLEDEDFTDGHVHTGLIADKGEALTHPPEAARAEAARLAAQWIAAPRNETRDPWAVNDGWRLNAPSRDFALVEDDAGVLTGPLASARNDLPTAGFVMSDGRVGGVSRGQTFVFSPPGASAELHAGEAGDEVKAPLPGKIVACAARLGQAVKKGDVLFTLEAMKMEHALKAPRDGVIAAVSGEEGAQVKEGAVLVRLAALNG